jgi:TetR/AcrR family acrAB operon transcriptional repressor
MYMKLISNISTQGKEMARRTKEEAAETRQQIIENAIAVFSRKGYSHTTFVDIAKHIGLSKGAVYWHFKTKTDLLVALIEFGLARKCRRVESPNDLEASLSLLRECYIGSAQNVLSDPLLRKFEFFIHFQIEWSEDLIDEVRTRLAEVGKDPFQEYSIAIKRLQDLGMIDVSQNSEALSTMLIAMWMGLMRMMMIGLFTESDLLHRLENHFDLIFKNIATKETLS